MHLAVFFPFIRQENLHTKILLGNSKSVQLDEFFLKKIVKKNPKKTDKTKRVHVQVIYRKNLSDYSETNGYYKLKNSLRCLGLSPSTTFIQGSFFSRDNSI